MFSIMSFDFPHVHLIMLFASVSPLSHALLVFSSLFFSPSPALESTFAQFNCDTRTISFMADHACVFSIKPGSCTLFIWGNHNSHGPAETNGKSLRLFFFQERYRKDPFPTSVCDGVEAKTVGVLAMKI